MITQKTSSGEPFSRPGRWLRLAFKLPVYLYRLRLGWLFGHQALLLTHRGRKSGRIYRTVLGTVRYDPQTRGCIVVSGYGPHADWYRNIQAQPALEVEIGRERYVPRQRFLPDDETVAELLAYERRQPRWINLINHALSGQMLDLSYVPTEEGVRQFASQIRMVAFEPESDSRHAGAERPGTEPRNSPRSRG
ncbi:MAG: nitroreductase family deazaflavin-dependent oxidoreductase [Rudaea sp.]